MPDRGKRAILELAYGRALTGRLIKREHCERLSLSTDVHDGIEPSVHSLTAHVLFLINHCVITRKVWDGGDLVDECIVVAFEHG